jgi:hypothetical protein
MFVFPVADLIAIAVYFAAVLLIGVWASRRIKNEEDSFLAGRHLPIAPRQNQPPNQNNPIAPNPSATPNFQRHVLARNLTLIMLRHLSIPNLG